MAEITKSGLDWFLMNTAESALDYCTTIVDVGEHGSVSLQHFPHSVEPKCHWGIVFIFCDSKGEITNRITFYGSTLHEAFTRAIGQKEDANG